MKNKFIAFLSLVVTASCIFSACNSSGNKGDASQAYKDSLAQSSAVVADTGNTIKADWEKFKTEADEKIKQNEDSIQVFKRRISKANAKIKVKLNKKVTRLEQKNNELKAKLINYKDEGKDKFETFKMDFDNSMDTLDINIKNFFKGKKK